MGPTSRRTRHLAVAVLAGLLVALTACGTGEDRSGQTTGARERLVVAVGTPSVAVSQVWAGLSAKYFDEAGLDVEVSLVGAANVVSTVVAGRADVAVSAVGLALPPVNDGKETAIIYGIAGGGAANFVVANANANIGKVSDCRKMASTSQGTSTYAWAVQDKALFGASYEISPFADASTGVASIVSGQTDCGVYAYGAVATAIKDQKLKLIFDPRSAAARPAGYPQALVETAVFGMKDRLQEKRSAVVKFIAALHRVTMEYYKADKPNDVARLLKQQKDWDTFTADNIVAGFGDTAFAFAPADGHIDKASWEAVATFLQRGGLAYVNPADSKWSAEQRVDMSYYDEAVK